MKFERIEWIDGWPLVQVVPDKKSGIFVANLDSPASLAVGRIASIYEMSAEEIRLLQSGEVDLAQYGIAPDRAELGKINLGEGRYLMLRPENDSTSGYDLLRAGVGELVSSVHEFDPHTPVE